MRITGKVKWFSNAKGYVIERDGGSDVFVHYWLSGRRIPVARGGMAVEFEIVDGQRAASGQRHQGLGRDHPGSWRRNIASSLTFQL
jgi:cold shock CspA family protein